jgi:membrane protease YdiL (CAAX protease family)
MNAMINKIRNQPSVVWGTGYIVCFTVIGGILNYTEPYDANPDFQFNLKHIILWIALYAPLFIFPRFGQWEIHAMGFTIGPVSIGASVLLAMICFPMTYGKFPTGYGAISEAFSRTGEEIFFRGFVFLFAKNIFPKSRFDWLWAAILSAGLFTAVHTQTFQPSYFADRTSMPVSYLIVERLLNIFFAGIALAILRYLTQSILPGAIVHSISAGSILTLPFVLILYFLILIWAWKRKEVIQTERLTIGNQMK